MPAAIRTLTSRLGLRYEPSVRADIDAHGARVALLAEDLADADPTMLEQAIQRWVSSKPFLPKASELIAIMDWIRTERRQAAQGPGATIHDRIAARNLELDAQGRRDIEWFIDQNGNCRIRDRDDWSAARRKQIAEEMEQERQRFNWRLRNPITQEQGV